MNNNQPRSCKICNRWFPTGKSMGGHMRSHLAKLPLPPKPYIPPPPPQQQQPAGLLLTSSDPPAPTPSYSPSSTLANSAEDEDSSYPVMTQTRSVRRKHTPPPPPPPPEQVTSSGEREAEVAMCLLMMSFGRGGGGGGKLYRCEKCNRGFGSYQALGGHRASHNKTGRQPVMMDYDDDGEEEDDEDYHHIIDDEASRIGSNSRRMFKCSICDKEFESGQALGGHKKVHFAEMNKMKKKPRLILSIDLNSPIPDQDDDDQQEVISRDAYRFSR